MNIESGNILCFGLGYTAQRLAARLIARGWSAAGTHRDGDATPDTHRFDRDHPLSAPTFKGVTHILISVPPDGSGDPVHELHRADIAALPDLKWLGYLSTTGVYGDRGGDWVDETDAPAPMSDRGARRVAAENAWRSLDIPVQVFRLAGIYGPGRSALDQVRAGTARRIVKPGHVFSRIHVDDIVTVLEASIDRPDPGAIYNVCDDEPASSADVVTRACEILGVAPPPEIPFETGDLSPMARSFYAEHRRVRNDKIKRDLGVVLRYPTYREGLAALTRG